MKKFTGKTQATRILDGKTLLWTLCTQTKQMWAIAGWYGRSPFLYYGTYHTRREAIKAHCDALGTNWDDCESAGDRAVKVVVTYTYRKMP